MTKLTDLVEVVNHGTLVTIRPLRPDVREWLEENTQDDATWWGSTQPALVVEPRYVTDLLTGLAEAWQ